MVQVSPALPTKQNGDIDISAWCARFGSDHTHVDALRLRDACEWVETLPQGSKLLERGLVLCELVGSLYMDSDALLAALLYRARREQQLTEQQVAERYSEQVAALVESVHRMASTSLLDLNNPKLLASERRDQVENIKRLLVALVDDARVAVIKIAERVVVLRQAKLDAASRRRRIALEAREVFAPLAGRLGIWHLKWELEDLAMRYLEPEIYTTIAKQLDGRRLEREKQVADIAGQLETLLRQNRVRAEVQGRAKHIYSIWRKMRAKGVSLDEVYDIRAVRILVEDLAGCYASLGVVHNHYKHVPSEFDDYVAAPKENGYRSIHTAVVGPDGKTLEVQIRTYDMHEEAELGVCAHWTYKGDSVTDHTYSEKMDWLRQVVEWHEELGGQRSLSEELQLSVRQERIYVYTPLGHVIDLTSEATPVDFAYRVHTDIGHHCIGALVDGVPTPLHTRLKNGQRVQIITDEAHQPERRWLENDPAYLNTNRARSKVQAYFRALGGEANVDAGRKLLADACEALAMPHPRGAALESLVERFEMEGAEGLWLALGSGDVTLNEVVAYWCERFDAQQSQLDLPGVTGGQTGMPHRLVLLAANRDGLLLDVTSLLSELKISLRGTTGTVLPEDQAELTLDFVSPKLFEVYRLIARLNELDGVSSVARVA